MRIPWPGRAQKDAADTELVLRAAFAKVGDRYIPQSRMEREMCEDMYRKGFLISYMTGFERSR